MKSEITPAILVAVFTVIIGIVIVVFIEWRLQAFDLRIDRNASAFDLMRITVDGNAKLLAVQQGIVSDLKSHPHSAWHNGTSERFIRLENRQDLFDSRIGNTDQEVRRIRATLIENGFQLRPMASAEKQ